MFHLPDTRWQAAGIHLVMSLVLFIILASIIYYLWYPSFLFVTDGGMQGIKLIAGVDLVMGPLLTLMVYNKAKKSIKMDLGIIFTLQVLCLIGGMWTVQKTAPVAVIYAGDTFTSANPDFFWKEEHQNLEILKQDKPVWITVDLPNDPAERQATVVSSIFTIGGSEYDINNYQNYSDNLEELQYGGFTLDQLREKEQGIEIPTLSSPENIRAYEVVSSYFFDYILVNTQTGEYVDLVYKPEINDEPKNDEIKKKEDDKANSEPSESTAEEKPQTENNTTNSETTN